jgi:hypothetical protein
MCDYSLEHVASREAKVSDALVTTKFSITSGFSGVGEPGIAVCLRPGTELAFDSDVLYETNALFFGRRQLAGRVARFRQIDIDKPYVHHDALEFPDGKIVLLTHLLPGQKALVLQTPSTGNHRHDDATAPSQTEEAQRPFANVS